ncbi:MAG: hypothetical protein JXA14_05245 [Anaerolineae bacterium]|nr:hypothetical protein [Anaerolineae bacterium]
MVFGALPAEHHEVQILTTSFQFSGLLETVGDVSTYINDSTRQSLSLHDAYLTPLTPGSPVRGLNRPHVVVLRPQTVFLYFTSAETRAAIRKLPKRELLVAYTPIAVCRGYFHMTGEARLRDFTDVIQEPLIPVSDARIFPLIEFPAPFPTEAELILVGLSQLQSYHPA